MPPVDELRQRIQSLAESVFRQREILRDLEQQYCAAQTELNASLDPMAARLPFELSSDILRQSLPNPTAWESVMALVGVSRAWRDIALVTPSLWSSISDQGIRPSKFPELLDIWVIRSRNCPISPSLRHTTSTTFNNIFVVLEKHANRVEKLDLWFRANYHVVDYPLVALKSLTIDGEAFKEKWVLPVPAILRLLRNAPNLVEFNFLCPELTAWEYATTLTHSNLRHIRLGRFDNHRYRYSGTNLLRRLGLPSLGTLSICGDAGDVGDWFQTCCPPLHSLRIYMGWGIDPTFFSNFLGSGITNLELICPETRRSILDVLSASPDLFPDLRNFVVLESVGRISHWQQHVLTFLATPRGRQTLESLRLKVPQDCYDKYVTVGFVEAVRYESGLIRVTLESADDYCESYAT
ncbi:hypothetical protein FB45DRAFT_1130703 [Roridomyces roridus]|uniref:F-box domain-containing protein n=1 Tax=Roridomyces roridus TaxID=1738132 RepID=A0AAD7FAX1_9AGAR|nr:hypothetical protein FB45DRAFT_1130703 [Roridomyces roridus]